MSTAENKALLKQLKNVTAGPFEDSLRVESFCTNPRSGHAVVELKDGKFNRMLFKFSEVQWLISELESAWAENEKLREALGFYADEKNWSDWEAFDDFGDRARKALGEK